MIKFYKLDENHNPVVCADIREMGDWMHNNMNETVVKKTHIHNIEISTVFLGLDHGIGEGKPILFETMIFGGEHDQYQERYNTWYEATEGHEKAVKLVKGEQ